MLELLEEALTGQVLAEILQLQRPAHPVQSTRPLGGHHRLVDERRHGVLGVLNRARRDLALEGHTLENVEARFHLLAEVLREV